MQQAQIRVRTGFLKRMNKWHLGEDIALPRCRPVLDRGLRRLKPATGKVLAVRWELSVITLGNRRSAILAGDGVGDPCPVHPADAVTRANRQ